MESSSKFQNIVITIAGILAILLVMRYAQDIVVPFLLSLFIGIYLGTNTLIGSIIEPGFMGRRVGLSTLVVFLSLVFWGWVLGPVGMLLSVPLTMVIKFAAQSSENSQWLAVLLGSEPQENNTNPDPISPSTNEKT